MYVSPLVSFFYFLFSSIVVSDGEPLRLPPTVHK